MHNIVFPPPLITLYRELAATDKNVEAFYHVFTVMIITAIAYSVLKDTVDAGEYVFSFHLCYLISPPNYTHPLMITPIPSQAHPLTITPPHDHTLPPTTQT